MRLTGNDAYTQFTNITVDPAVASLYYLRGGTGDTAYYDPGVGGF
jgi:hypothetical protein